MSVREFKDERGRQWRAWDIRPDVIHPQTKAEDYLAECYDVGWIVFETTAGDEKRRLCPYPRRWAEADDVELRAMLARADAVAPHKLAAERRTVGVGAGAGAGAGAGVGVGVGTAGEAAGAGAPAPSISQPPANGTPPSPSVDRPSHTIHSDHPDVTDLIVVRSFRYPGGRIWTVCQVDHPESGGPPVLRFTAGMRWVDVKTWPKDWADAPDSQLAELLRRAMPRPPAPAPGPATPRRRSTDR